jgi:arginyl-tRNA synthetase
VVREYYINDVGNQINTLGKSLYFRLRELQGEKIEFPEDGYQGDYMKDLARDYLAANNPLPSPTSTEEEFVSMGRYAGDVILAGIKKDLEDFGVTFDRWFSETGLYRQGLVEKSFARLQEKGFLYGKDGALWFKSTVFGDDKDRVVRRSNGASTYFA